MKSGSSVEVRLPSELGFEKVALSTAASVATLMGFSADRVEDLKTAVAEACINAIEHGNQLNDSLTVGVVLSTTDDELEVRVIDDGCGVNETPGALLVYGPPHRSRRLAERAQDVDRPAWYDERHRRTQRTGERD